jgi:hypothetical protein
MIKAGSGSRRLTLTWPTPQAWPAQQHAIEALLLSCDRALGALEPDWVGHCKAMLNVDGQVAYGSVGMASAPPTWAGGPLPDAASAELTLYAAIYGLDEQQVAAALDVALATLRQERGAA